MAANRVKLTICGSSYVVSTGDSEEYLMGLAERLDKDMSKIMTEAPNASVTAAAVITALSYLDEAEKSAFGADNMRAQIQGYLEDASRAKLAAEEAKREAERLRNELSHYESAGKRGGKGRDSLLDYGQDKKSAAAPAQKSADKPAEKAEDREEIDGQIDLNGVNDPI